MTNLFDDFDLDIQKMSNEAAVQPNSASNVCVSDMMHGCIFSLTCPTQVLCLPPTGTGSQDCLVHPDGDNFINI